MKGIKPALLLSFVVFLAFGFQTVGIFSDPISRGQLPLASEGKYNYGVLGWCPKSSSKDCSSYSFGYEFQDGSSNSWSKSTQRTMSKVLIVHIIAAGLLLISLFLAIATHWPNMRLWVVVEIMLGLSFLASALSFAVEMAMFRLKLKFAGWFTLPAAILTLIATVALGLMQRSLKASLGRTSVNGKNALLDNNPLSFDNGGFVVGSDEKFMKQPSVTSNRVSIPSFQIPRPSSLLMPHRGYEKVSGPSSQDGTRSLTGSQTRLNQQRDLPSSSTESIGAVSRQTQNSGPGLAGQRTGPLPGQPGQRMGPQQGPRAGPGQPSMAQRQQPLPRLPQDSPMKQAANNSPGSRVRNLTGLRPGNPADAGAAGAANAGAGGAGAAAGIGAAGAAAGAAGAAGMANARAGAQGNQPRQGQRQQTWSQQALSAQGSPQRRQQPYMPVHASNVSVASTEAARIPAGSYLPGVEGAGRYNGSSSRAPQVRSEQPVAAESATMDYHKDETQSESPVSKSKVPNFSRFSAQDSTAETSTTAISTPYKKQPMKPMLERFVEAESMSSETREPQEPFFDAPITRITTQSPVSEYSHYTSVSERNHPAELAVPQQAQPNKPTQAADPQAMNQLQQQQAYYQYQYQQQYMQQLAQAQGYNQGYNQSYNQASYPAYQQQYGYGQAYQPGYQEYQAYSPNVYNQGRPNPQYAPRPQGNVRSPKPRQQAPMARSDMALQTNPDFSIGDISRRKRPGRR